MVLRKSEYDAGSTTPAVVVILIGAVLTVSLAIEIGRFSIAARQAAYVADLSAEAAATALDQESLADGDLILDRRDATRFAESMSDDLVAVENRSLTVSVTASEVCVDVLQTYRPSLLPLPGVAINASACASPMLG